MCPSSTVLWAVLSRLFSGILLFIPWGSLQGISGLRLMNLHVPTSVMQGESVWLNCTLDMERDELYSVKWYKNDEEFYRYLPRDSPSGQKYDLPGVFVDLQKSRQGSVFLKKTDLYSEGLYRCEASAESPTFQTVEGEKQMNVYALPEEGPSIYGNLHKYEIGDFVNVTCKSGPSKPAATLIWFINGQKAPPEYIAIYPVIDHLNGLQTSKLGLAFVVSHRHLGHDGTGAITLRCTSIVSQTYSMSSEELVVGDKVPEIQSVTATRLPLINQLYSREGPVISGGRFHYKAGDSLNINCSSTKSRSAPELQWFLNDKKVDDFNVIKYPVTRYPDGQEKSILGLTFNVSPVHFDEQEEMRLKCTATLSEVINMRSDEKTVGGNHRSSGLHVSENIGKVSERSSSGCRVSSSDIWLLLYLVLNNLFIWTLHDIC